MPTEPSKIVIHLIDSGSGLERTKADIKAKADRDSASIPDPMGA